jgi:Protein of unknown function (DUF3108)
VPQATILKQTCFLIAFVAVVTLFPLLGRSEFPVNESLSASPAARYSLMRAFKSGERLAFALFWFTIPAGTAVMEVSDSVPVDGRPTLKLFSTAKSSKLVSRFYPVNNTLESVIDADDPSPHHTVFHRREGKKKNDFDITFHHDTGKVQTIKDGNAEELPIPPHTQDVLSCLYYLRSLPKLVPGTSVFLNVHHDKKNYRLEVRVEGYEKVPSPWGEVEAVRVLAIMPFQGIFMNEGNIRVWLTNDVSHVPLMMKAKVMVGSVVARLVDASGMPPR